MWALAYARNLGQWLFAGCHRGHPFGTEDRSFSDWKTAGSYCQKLGLSELKYKTNRGLCRNRPPPVVLQNFDYHCCGIIPLRYALGKVTDILTKLLQDLRS